MTFMLLTSTLLSLTLVGLFLFQSRVHQQTSSELQRQLEVCQTTLHQFMLECEATLTEVSRVVGKSAQRFDAPMKPVEAAEVARVELAPPVKKPSCEKTAKVLTLLNRGVQVADIANQLMIPQGEIDLILSLNQRS